MNPRGSIVSIYDMIFNLVRIGIVFAFVENSEGLLDLTIGFIHELKTGFKEEIFLLSGENPIICEKALYFNDHFFMDKLIMLSPTLQKYANKKVLLSKDELISASDKRELAINFEEE